jgi:hypothetical protein
MVREGGGGLMEFKMGDEYSNLGVTEVKYIIGKQPRKEKENITA